MHEYGTCTCTCKCFLSLFTIIVKLVLLLILCIDKFFLSPARTPGTGLYDNLQQYKIADPTAIFDISFFVHNPKPFFTLARELYPGRYQPNAVHPFVKLLQDRGVLLRNYTQNIDGLERRKFVVLIFIPILGVMKSLVFFKKQCPFPACHRQANVFTSVMEPKLSGL